MATTRRDLAPRLRSTAWLIAAQFAACLAHAQVNTAPTATYPNQASQLPPATLGAPAFPAANQGNQAGQVGNPNALPGEENEDLLGQKEKLPPRYIRPTLGARATVTDNSTQVSSNKREEVILAISPGLAFQYQGANSNLVGQLQLSAVHYLNGTQDDRLLPNGLVNFHTDIGRQGFGLDASLAAEQVKSQYGAISSSAPSTNDTYTNTRARVSPFLERDLSDSTKLSARIERSQTRSDANNNALSTRPNTSTNGASLNLTQRPQRLGYALDARYEDNKSADQDDSIYKTSMAKATLLYALTPELEIGAFGGHESTRVFQQHNSDSIKGGQFDWRPTNRTQVKARVEDRFFGTGWVAEASHRLPWLAVGMTSSRQPDVYPNSIGTLQGNGATRALLDAMLTTRVPNEADRSRAVEDIIARRNLPEQLGSSRDLYDLNAQLRQSTALRASVMGRRTIVTVVAGQSQSRPLAGETFASVLGPGNSVRERYTDLNVNQRLTRQSTLSTGLRWNRARTYSPLLGTTTNSREFSLRFGVNTNLSKNALLSWGLRRQQSRNPDPVSVTENIAFVGVDYRF